MFLGGFSWNLNVYHLKKIVYSLKYWNINLIHSKLWCQTFNILWFIAWFSAKHTSLRTKNKDWLACNVSVKWHVYQWTVVTVQLQYSSMSWSRTTTGWLVMCQSSDMSTSELLLQSSYNTAQCLGLVQSRNNQHLNNHSQLFIFSNSNRTNIRYM